MSELTPGTPEYQEAYEKEMQRLEAEAGKSDKDKAASNTSEVKAEEKKDAKADERKEPTAAELAAQIDEERKAREKLEKALKDTQRWGHQNAAEVSRLKKEADERKRRETLAEDPVLKANPGLEDAIKRVAGRGEEPAKDSKETWLSTVAQALPDIDDLLGDKDFHAKAAAKKSELGGEWDNPISAIRELSALRAEHVAEQRTRVAVEAARKDFETKAKKKGAMEIPGGSGGKDTPQGQDAVKRYQTMSTEEFAKERSRVMGY